MQRYYCKNCHRKFADNDALPKMKTPVWIISLALHCYYNGMSLEAIQVEINQRHGAYYAQSSIYNWITRFSREAVRQVTSVIPKAGNIWFLCITPFKTGDRFLWFYDAFDVNSKFLLASHISEDFTGERVLDFVISVCRTVLKPTSNPIKLLSDYSIVLNSIGKRNRPDFSNQIVFKKMNKSESVFFYKLLEKRNKVVHSFRSINNAQTLTDAWRVHYNYLMKNDKVGTARFASQMIKTPFKNWADIIIGSKPHTAKLKTIKYYALSTKIETNTHGEMLDNI